MLVIAVTGFRESLNHRISPGERGGGKLSHRITPSALGEQTWALVEKSLCSEVILRLTSRLPVVTMHYINVVCLKHFLSNIRDKNPNAAFFLRNREVLDDIPESFHSRFVDKEPLSRLHLKVTSLLSSSMTPLPSASSYSLWLSSPFHHFLHHH